MNTLPSFLVPTVSQNHLADFCHSQVNLAHYVNEHATGLILYFYPKDNTTGCSLQAEDFSQHLARFNELGYQVMGVSRDSLKSHEKFIANKTINFPLIRDPDEQLCQYFGIIGEKKLYGKVSLGVVRSTLVFDATGTLIHELRNVRAKGHVEKLLSLLAPLSATP